MNILKNSNNNKKIHTIQPIFSKERYLKPLSVAEKGTERSAASLHAWHGQGECLLFAEMELAAKRHTQSRVTELLASQGRSSHFIPPKLPTATPAPQSNKPPQCMNVRMNCKAQSTGMPQRCG